MDVPMLKPAAEAVLVNGTPALCKKTRARAWAQRDAGRVVLSRQARRLSMLPGA